jgi:hypothetical protein
VVIFLTAIIFRRSLHKPNGLGQEGNPFYKSSIPQGLKSLAGLFVSTPSAVAAPDGGYFFDGHYFQAKVIQTQLFWTGG